MHVVFQPDANIEEALHFRLLVVNQNVAGGTFQPLQAYYPSKTKFLSASVSGWMETPFYWFSIFEVLKYGGVCVTLCYIGAENGWLWPQSAKKLFTGRRVMLITICYLAGISTQLSYTERK